MFCFLRASCLLLLSVSLIFSPFVAGAMTALERDQLRAITEWFPYVACQEQKMLRQCFVWLEEECQTVVGLSATSCLRQYQSEWMQPGNSTLDLWRQKITACTIRDVGMKMKSRSVKSLLCENKGAPQ